LSGFTVAIISTAFLLQSAQAQQTVKIGAYHFPYATNTADGMGGMVESDTAGEERGRQVPRLISGRSM